MAVTRYLYHLSIYTGKSQGTGKTFGSSVINVTVDIVEKHYLNTRFILITFFTSYQLLVDLSIRDVKAVGTVREN